MENSFVPPRAGVEALTPSKAKKFFEYFKPGSVREVVLLGDIAEQRMHFVRSLNFKVMCGSSRGSCALCMQAGMSADISPSTPDMVAPSYVRSPKDAELVQRVAVFTEGMAERVLELLKGAPARASRLLIRRISTQRYEIALRGECRHVLPHAFDLLPWYRARFNNPQEASRPLMLLPPLKAKELELSPISRPKPLDISLSDAGTGVEELNKMREMMDRRKAEEGKGQQPARSTSSSSAPPPADASTIETSLDALEEQFPSAKPSMVPTPSKAISGLRGGLQRKLEQTKAQEARLRSAILHLPPEDVPTHQAVAAGDTFAELTGAIAKGGA